MHWALWSKAPSCVHLGSPQRRPGQPAFRSLPPQPTKQQSQHSTRQWRQPLLHALIWASMASAAAATPDPNQVQFAAGDQLVPEIYVAQLQPSLDFFTSFGFKVERSEHGFAVLRWGPSALYLEETPDYAQIPPGVAHHGQAGNIRVLVPDVDAYHALAKERGCSIIRDIRDQEYGLRDFTVAGPDGVALRFATPLPGQTDLH